MKDKENQIIEELANDIYSLKSCDTSFEENCKLLSYDLVTLGWIKPDKNSVVLSKEEYEILLNKECLRGWIWKEGFNDGKKLYSETLACMRDTIENQKVELENKGKETAEKFIKECKKYKVKKFSPVGIDQRDTGVSWIEMPEWKFDEFAKQFDIEIQE